MRRAMDWGIAAAVAVLLPILLRLMSGQPAIAGTESYAIANVLEHVLPRPIPMLSIVAVSTAAFACAVMLAHKTLRKSLSKWSLYATLGLIVASPAILATSMYPTQAIFALLFALALAAKKQRDALLLFGATLLLVAVHAALTGVRPAAEALVELGGLNAYGLFALIAAIVGAYVLWENKARNYFITLAMLALVALSFVLPSLMFFGTVAVAAVAGIGLARLRKQRWVFPLVRTMTLVLFFCGILFATISSFTLLTDAPPSAALASGFAELQFSLPEGAVLSHASYDSWIRYWAQRPVARIPADVEENIWYSRNLENTTELLRTYHVSSVVVTEEMRQGLVWSEDEEGLLFLMAHSSRFEPTANGAWSFIPSRTEGTPAPGPSD